MEYRRRTGRCPLTYEEFLQTKNLASLPTGFEISKSSIHPMLFPHQVALVQWAVRRGKSAIFAMTGLGKTLMYLEWSRLVAEHTDGSILILAPLGVVQQTVEEAKKIDIDIRVCESQADVTEGIHISNYEKLHKFDAKVFSGVVLDESSLLKNYSGATRNAIIELFTNTPYKLACTATPAPNDYMELGNHSEFLGVMSRVEMLSMFFVHDGGDTAKWRLKGHAQEGFWKWVSSWGAMVRKPSDLGFSDDDYALPPLSIEDVVVHTDKAPEGYLFAMEAQTLQERQAARRSTVEERCRAVADLVQREPHEKWLIWCDYNAEQDELERLFGDRCVSIRGKTPDDQRIELERAWRLGDVPYFISKGSIFGAGMNWQHCSRMVFAGVSDSFENQFQAIRRCYRFGQTRPVKVYMVTSDLEGAVAMNVKRKESDFEKMQEEMSQFTREFVRENVQSAGKTQTAYLPSKGMVLPQWLM